MNESPFLNLAVIPTLELKRLKKNLSETCVNLNILSPLQSGSGNYTFWVSSAIFDIQQIVKDINLELKKRRMSHLKKILLIS